MNESPRFLGLSPAVAAILVIAAATLFRFFYCTWLPLLPDEAYYFQWSRHLDASYFSKGPAVAYTIAAGTWLFGDNNLGIRFFAVLLSAGTAWQLFLLARRWFDDVVALIAVLIAGVVPLYAIGAVIMTIDPLSAFFWLWAANFFSSALATDRWRDWLLTGFAVGCGFLGKYINAMELLAFLVFLLLVPARRRILLQPKWWAMLAVAVFCTWPVWWWNHRHGWSSVSQLKNRGELNGPFGLHPADFLDFLFHQALVVSPLLFIALLLVSSRSFGRVRRALATEGEVLLLVLFYSIFLFYTILAWHLRGEPNWPAVSYLTLIILLAAQWRDQLARPGRPIFIIVTYLLAFFLMTFLHQPEILHLPPRMDPMGRAVGWDPIAHRLDDLRQEQSADYVIADAYKEASIFSFHFHDRAFIHTLRHSPPANQFDFWPTYSVPAGTRALWITGEPRPNALQGEFDSVTPLEHVIVSFHDRPFREYMIYLCVKNPAPMTP